MFLTNEERELLQRIQPGDEVARRSGEAWDRVTVTHVIKALVLIAGRHYRKWDGGEIGYSELSNRYIAPLNERTLKSIADWEHELYRNRLVNRIRAAKLRDLPLEVLEQVAEMVEGAE